MSILEQRIRQAKREGTYDQGSTELSGPGVFASAEPLLVYERKLGDVVSLTKREQSLISGAALTGMISPLTGCCGDYCCCCCCCCCYWHCCCYYCCGNLLRLCLCRLLCAQLL